jgi:hypothetical protein
VLQDLPDDRLFLDESDDPHVSATFRAEQRIDFVNLLYQAGPGAASGPGLGGVVLNGRCLRRLCFKALLPPLSPLNAGVPTIVSDEVLSSVRDMRRDGGQEVERVVYLKVPIRPLAVSSSKVEASYHMRL